MDHHRFVQTYRGVPIFGSEVIVHGKGDDIDFLNGTYHPAFDLANVSPSLSSTEAMVACVNDRGPAAQYQHFMGILGESMKDKINLVIYPHNGAYKLAYHITTYKNLAHRWEYFVDAKDGSIIEKYESLCKLHNHGTNSNSPCMADEPQTVVVGPQMDGKATANALDLLNITRTINTYQVGTQYYLIDGSRDIFASSAADLPDNPDGVIWTIDAFNTSPERENEFKYDHVKSGNNTWSNKTGVSAHFNGGKAYEYFRDTHNRKSINGQGGNIISLINVTDENDASMGNAFWNGQAMFYGNGDGSFKELARGLDVAGHEMTHGVIQSTANLVYQGESGALNESFADVFGTMIDREDWLMGEDVVKTTAFPSGALRSIQDPHNGQSPGNFNKGWQPRIYSERYTGSEDNGGVHINSGIPNWAFFKFATAVGKDKAEKVYYRALSNYMTKSSKFTDCRVAVVKAATDLYGATEVAAAKKAFDEVGILGETGGNYENDVQDNPGQDFVLVTDASNNGLYILDGTGQSLGKISNKGVLSKPSVSDDGQNIVFIGKDKQMHYISIDWGQNPPTIEEDVLEDTPMWRNVIISKKGNLIAALDDQQTNEIIVFDVSVTNGAVKTFELYNPTFTTGSETGDVNYADAMEFDHSGENIMYDAENQINSLTQGAITYWDISFINVWNNSTKKFTQGNIEKLFSSLPSDVSVGNPTFSKNSPYIIAFDYINKDNTVDIIAANTERGEANIVYDNEDLLGYPNFSSDDKNLLFDTETSAGAKVVGIQGLDGSKIKPQGGAFLFTSNRRWAVWFSNGSRNLSSADDTNTSVSRLSLTQNPVNTQVSIQTTFNEAFSGQVMITNLIGSTLYKSDIEVPAGQNIITLSVEDYPIGLYNVSIVSQKGVSSLQFSKI
jgi:bacillolysin